MSKIRSQEHKTIFELITYMVVDLVPGCVWRLCCLRDLMKQMRSLNVSTQISLVYIHIFISTRLQLSAGECEEFPVWWESLEFKMSLTS